MINFNDAMNCITWFTLLTWNLFPVSKGLRALDVLEGLESLKGLIFHFLTLNLTARRHLVPGENF